MLRDHLLWRTEASSCVCMKRFALLNANGVKPPLLLSYLSLYMPRKWASLVLYTDTLVGKK